MTTPRSEDDSASPAEATRAPGGSAESPAPSVHRPTWSELHRDTDPAVDAGALAALRAASGAERLRQAVKLTVATRRLALAGLRRRHPEATERELLLLLAEMLYGREVTDLARRSDEPHDSTSEAP